MNLEEALSGSAQPDSVKRDKPSIPKLGEPGTWEWNGSVGVVNTKPTLERVTSWDEYLVDAGLDPEVVEVIEPVNIRGWDANAGGGDVVRMHYYSLKVRLRTNSVNIDDLLELIKNKKEVSPPEADENGSTFVVALGDLQLGKMDGDGVAGTFERVIKGIDAAAEKIKKSENISELALFWLGDCIEGFVSQGGNNAWRTVLTPTEQTKLLRRIMFYAIDTFAPLVPSMTTVAIPGNHDQGIRFGKGGVTKYNDSFDVDSLSAVEDACKIKPENYGHVKFYTPQDDEMTVTFETNGSIIGAAHGHQMTRAKHFTWWSSQSFGDFPIGQADILLTGHYHHFLVEQSGKRTFVQVPALEAESTWYRHRTGEPGSPGILTFVTKNSKINALEIV